MSTEIKNRFSDQELAEFKVLIEEKIEKANEDLSLLKSVYMNDGNNGTDDTSPTFKAFEEGSQTMSKEANTQLAIRQEKFIRDLKNREFSCAFVGQTGHVTHHPPLAPEEIVCFRFQVVTSFQSSHPNL